MSQLKKHQDPDGNLNNFKWVRKIENSRGTIRVTVQGWSILLTGNGRGSLHGSGSIEPRLPPRRKRRTKSFIDGIHARDSWYRAVWLLHPHSRQLVGEGWNRSLV